MGIDNLTLFELHFDGAQFGPKNIASPDASEDDEMAEDVRAPMDVDAPDESGGGRRFLSLVAMSTLVAVGATLLARRLFGDDEQTTVEEFADEADETTVEIETDEPVA